MRKERNQEQSKRRNREAKGSRVAVYFYLGDEVGGEGSVVLTGAGAAPLLPPGSWFRTLGSKCATHGRFHLPPNQRYRAEGEQKEGYRSAHTGLPCQPMPFSFQLTGSEFHLPKLPSTLPIHLSKFDSAPSLSWT